MQLAHSGVGFKDVYFMMIFHEMLKHGFLGIAGLKLLGLSIQR